MPKPKPNPPGIGNPWPTPHATGTVSVTLIGDSLTVQSGPYVAGGLLWAGMTNPTVTNLGVGATGLLDDQGDVRFANLIDAVPAGSIVVVQYSGNCFFGAGGVCPFVPGSTEFLAAWEQQMRNRIAYIKSKGLKQVWVKSPLVGPAQGGHANTVYNVGLLTQRVCSELGLTMVDWGQALNDTNGNYTDSLWYGDAFNAPSWHVVRETDQLHFTVPEGGKRAGAWTAEGIIRAYLL